MKQLLTAFAAVVLVASVSFADEPTFESVQVEFQQKTLSLASAEDATFTDLQAMLAKFAGETFGAHPDLMRKEAEKRFKSLPQFPAMNLTAYVEHKSSDQFQIPPLQAGTLWLVYGCSPEALSDAAKANILSRELGVEEYGRRVFLNRFCPDKLYRLAQGKLPDLVVESLGDLFVIEVEMTKAGVCKPVSVKWMKKKGS